MLKYYCIALLLFLFSCFESNTEGVSKYSKPLNDSSRVQVVYTHQYDQGYAVAYPAQNNLYYTKIERVEDSIHLDSVKIKLTLKNSFPFFTHYVFIIDGKTETKTHKNEFTFVFSKKEKQIVFQHLKIGVFSGEETHSDFEMKVSFDPKSFFEKSGRILQKDEFLIYQTDVSFMEIEQDKFVRYSLTAKEKEEGRKVFGFDLKEAKFEKEKVQLLTLDLLKALSDARGVPSDTMAKISPLLQYQRACANKDNVWCGNLINIYLYACACYDIKARLICLGNTYNSDADPIIYNADHHSIAEVYYDQSWHLIDMSFYVMDAKIEGRSLNFVDFFHLINIPQERKKIMITFYDKVSKSVKNTPLDQAYRNDKLRAYYKQNQKFSFPYHIKDGLGFFTF